MYGQTQGMDEDQTRVYARNQAYGTYKKMSEAAIDMELYEFMEQIPLSWNKARKIKALLDHKYGEEHVS